MDALLNAATTSEVTTRHHTQKEGNRYAHHSTLFSKEHMGFVQTAKVRRPFVLCAPRLDWVGNFDQIYHDD